MENIKIFLNDNEIIVWGNETELYYSYVLDIPLPTIKSKPHFLGIDWDGGEIWDKSESLEEIPLSELNEKRLISLLVKNEKNLFKEQDKKTFFLVQKKYPKIIQKYKKELNFWEGCFDFQTVPIFWDEHWKLDAFGNVISFPNASETLILELLDYYFSQPYYAKK